MRASTGVSKESADLVSRFGRKDVLELAGLLLDLGFAVHGQAIGKQSLRQAVTADDAAGAFAAARREFHDQRAIAKRRGHRLKRIVAGIHERLVIVRMRRMRRGNHQIPSESSSRSPG